MDVHTWIDVIHVFVQGCILITSIYGLYLYYLEKKRCLVVPPGKNVLTLRNGNYVLHRAGMYLLERDEQLVSFLWFRPEMPSKDMTKGKYVQCTEIDDNEQHMSIAKEWMTTDGVTQLAIKGTVQFRVNNMCNLAKVARPLLLLEVHAKSAIFNALMQYKPTDSRPQLEHQIAYYLNQDISAYGMYCTRFIVENFQRLE